MKIPFKRVLSLFLVFLCIFGFTGISDGILQLKTISAATYEDYPISLVQIGTYDTTSNIAASGTDLVTASASGVSAQSWYFEYAGSDGNGNYFRLINAASGRAISVSGTVADGADCSLAAVSDSNSQLWYISAVQNDSLGFGLYYKIASRADTNYVLANYNGTIAMSGYSGNSSQKWLLNMAGLQGFAGYTKTIDGGVKASTIGGLLGEVVEVDTFDELKQYATSDTPYTIVVTANIKVTSLTKDSSGRYYCPDGRIYVHSNKTIVGSYGAHTLYNVQFCTSSNRGTGDNLIIRNFELQHDAESNGNDSIVVYFGSGKNLWVDHCTFVGHSDYNTASTGLEDWDKFLACCYDADYCTVSESSFGLHEYGLILGYPADDENSYNTYNNFPCMTLSGNYFYETLTRGPGLMRYGYYHSLNNYVNTFSMAYTVHTACKIYAESCYYENGGNVICDWNTVTYPGSYAEDGSTFVSCNRTTIEGYAQNCTWRPSSNYSYTSMTADEAKSYTTANSGAKNAPDQMKYFCLDHDLSMKPTAESYAELDPAMLYRFENVNSGMYLSVEDGSLSSGSNVQQDVFSASEANKDKTLWSVKDAGDGYYYLYTYADPSGSLCIDLPYGSTDNGTSIGLWSNDESDARKFKLVNNGDGSYTITTKCSSDASCFGVAGDSVEAGADVIQWTRTGNTSQSWYIQPVHPILNGELIQRLERYDHVGASTITIESGLAVGSMLFGDREVTYVTLPEEVLGAEYIRTACDSKAATTPVGLFDAAKDCTVYVVMDVRVSTEPAWLSDWTLTEMTAVSSNDVTFKIYQREVKAGESVSLGGNGQASGCVNYTVFVKETETVQEIIGDVNADDALSLVDIVMLQKWLLCVGELTDAQAADLNGDGKVNGFDLAIMKRILIG